MSDTPTLIVRPAEREDAPAILAVHRESFLTLCATHYEPDVLAHYFANKTVAGYHPAIDRREMLVCQRGAEIIGMAHAVPGEIAGLFVHPDAARQGVGRLLMQHALPLAMQDHSGPVRLEATLNAVPFYERCGFVAVKQYALMRRGVAFVVVEMRYQPKPAAPSVAAP